MSDRPMYGSLAPRAARFHGRLVVLLVLLFGCEGQIEGERRVAGNEDPLCESRTSDPGRVTLRRLARAEYNNTVRDLLGSTSKPADAFPREVESGDGFSNNADVLSIEKLLIEKYDAASQALVTAALAPDSTFRTRYLGCAASGDERACARKIAEEFGLHAFRRPLATGETDRLLEVVLAAQREGGTFEEGIGLMLRAVLLSPKFLFRSEPPPLDEPVRRLNDYEVASRLSYFLWSSMPDEDLFSAAAQGRLDDKSELRKQAERMLQDPKADALYENFVLEWLGLVDLYEKSPDRDRFPTFDEELRQAFQQETIRFVRTIVETNESVATLLNADFTFLNERLARHYGIDGVTGADFRRVELADSARGGLLTQGSVLIMTSHPNRTSPVKRGEWVLDRLLCSPPPDPPPDVDTFLGSETESATLRERLEKHRADPSCATCHRLMDPIGLGLENFDAIGAWRDRDGTALINASGELPDGQTFNGERDLSALLHEDERYASCVAKKLAAYALGRSLVAADRCQVERLVEETRAKRSSVRELILQIVTSDVFTRVGSDREANP